MKERDHFVDLGADRRVIIGKDLKEISWEGLDRIHLAQDRCKWGDSCDSGNVHSGYMKAGNFMAS
jgi:hypothetical protein